MKAPQSSQWGSTLVVCGFSPAVMWLLLCGCSFVAVVLLVGYLLSSDVGSFLVMVWASLVATSEGSPPHGNVQGLLLLC